MVVVTSGSLRCLVDRSGPGVGEDEIDMRAGGWDVEGSHEASWGRGPRRFLLGAVVGTLVLLAASLGTGSEALSAEPDDGAARATPVTRCLTIPGNVTYKNERGETLAFFSMSQKSCWDGSRITYLSVPLVSVGVTRVGVANGWSYNGISGRRDVYFEYKDSPQGGHLTTRKASFTFCGASGCFKRTPVIKRYAYFDKAGFRIARP